MTAKEQFEKLGYEYNEDDFYIRYYENNDMTVKNNIIFCKEQKCIELIPKFNNKDHYFTRMNMSLLQAINKQISELGWE